MSHIVRPGNRFLFAELTTLRESQGYPISPLVRDLTTRVVKGSAYEKRRGGKAFYRLARSRCLTECKSLMLRSYVNAPTGLLDLSLLTSPEKDVPDLFVG